MIILFIDLTRRNLLLPRSYLSAKKITASQVPIDEELVNLGHKASAEYKNALNAQRKKEEDREAKIREKEEQEKMKELARKDKERKSELQKIQIREHDIIIQQQEAEVCNYFKNVLNLMFSSLFFITSNY